MDEPGTDVTALPEWSVRPGLLETTMYAAAMWEFPRIHFDHVQARREGLGSAIVHGPLLGNYLVHTIEAWAGRELHLERLGWRHHAVVPVDERLRCGGSVTGPLDDGRFELSLWIRGEDGSTKVSGTASLRPRTLNTSPDGRQP